jgi:hypothetical protein
MTGGVTWLVLGRAEVRVNMGIRLGANHAQT